MKTYLVTGGAGFIGSNFIIYMLNKYDDVKIVNLDSLTYAGNLQNLESVQNNKNYTFIRGDICDNFPVNKIFNDYDVDYVVNFAAESHVDRSIADPDIFVRTNVLGTLNLLNCAKKAWFKDGKWQEGRRFHQVGTDEVYGSLGDTGFFTEDSKLDPHSPYSASKTSADLMAKSYFDTYNMPISITRCSNNYGPFQFPEKLIPLLINNAVNHKDIPVYGDGLNVRDWLYVEDHCKAIDMVIREGIEGQVYNIGGHNERKNIEIVKEVIDYLNDNYDKTITRDLITYVEDRKGHDRRYAIDPKKIKDELGWYPETPFNEGIIKTIRWYLDNKIWMDEVISGEYERINCNI
ncbi:MAG: dTDP-glucose 4,6-dehydratase [Clostridium sp.]|uniref:dTDP-glucose 4,6-dehydratase n=1 Tax=Clostridium sp. TaxID=1506 RepID=UPI0030541626